MLKAQGKHYTNVDEFLVYMLKNRSIEYLLTTLKDDCLRRGEREAYEFLIERNLLDYVMDIAFGLSKLEKEIQNSFLKKGIAYLGKEYYTHVELINCWKFCGDNFNSLSAVYYGLFRWLEEYKNEHRKLPKLDMFCRGIEEYTLDLEREIVKRRKMTEGVLPGGTKIISITPVDREERDRLLGGFKTKEELAREDEEFRQRIKEYKGTLDMRVEEKSLKETALKILVEEVNSMSENPEVGCKDDIAAFQEAVNFGIITEDDFITLKEERIADYISKRNELLDEIQGYRRELNED